jgi:hypothetical protein
MHGTGILRIEATTIESVVGDFKYVAIIWRKLNSVCCAKCGKLKDTFEIVAFVRVLFEIINT